MSRILIIEDQEFFSRTLHDKLEEGGFFVDSADSRESVVNQITKQKPDIILLDLLMSHQEGFVILKELKESPSWNMIPVVVLASLGGDEQIKRALEMGADDYFVKSQHPLEEVVEKVKTILLAQK